ncbi:Rrf2 family transcriptional regulator [Paucilactobacillus hokkaidonensis]|uniref:Rrf2 family transcriptional regulator n=1 Tax=Paucilactobacillus hokkaidonensis TaxID=1193095 RepID=UPI0006D224CC|nr:Rrf2 family transcriptional regulator [Paucilactobacillus hokkaidonensis]
MRKLVVADLVKSVSGNNGGFTLAKPAEQITVYSMVEAVEGEIHSYPNFGFIDRVFFLRHSHLLVSLQKRLMIFLTRLIMPGLRC